VPKEFNFIVIVQALSKAGASCVVEQEFNTSNEY